MLTATDKADLWGAYEELAPPETVSVYRLPVAPSEFEAIGAVRNWPAAVEATAVVLPERPRTMDRFGEPGEQYDGLMYARSGQDVQAGDVIMDASGGVWLVGPVIVTGHALPRVQAGLQRVPEAFVPATLRTERTGELMNAVQATISEDGRSFVGVFALAVQPGRHVIMQCSRGDTDPFEIALSEDRLTATYTLPEDADDLGEGDWATFLW